MNRKPSKMLVLAWLSGLLWTSVNDYLVGPPGLEPGTKGFTLPDAFAPAWTISSPSACAGGVREALACYQGHFSPQVVSAPSGGVPPAWLRIALGRTVRVSLNSSRFSTGPYGAGVTFR